ncbi:hypothetical protein E2562_011412 [Oryza meyeriana var. granulata]|uniref:Uncharacterized protein n=1 Tax=Oryza meyeriana var. granulata TaxID=110450 RepID=A0A6G1D2Q0_9ORYZ|nr:hypothetical protein E2562_011412 [Oryza meyeriana var. granulata]
MADIAGGEHRVQMQAQSGGRRGQQVSAPEKSLNCFVRVVALMERTGNALGTLAFTWATVVLLGGCPTLASYYVLEEFEDQRPITGYAVPAALVRVVLALLRLVQHNYFGDSDMTNLGPSLSIFYGMVLGQGILYIVAGMLEVFSFIPRRSLVRHGGFTGQWGVESVSLYYAYA